MDVSSLEGTPVLMVNCMISLTIGNQTHPPGLACGQWSLLSMCEVGFVHHFLEFAGVYVTSGLLRKATPSHLISVSSQKLSVR